MLVMLFNCISCCPCFCRLACPVKILVERRKIHKLGVEGLFSCLNFCNFGEYLWELIIAKGVRFRMRKSQVWLYLVTFDLVCKLLTI
uniref:Putative ovule protein n=1 Tax=Solanum chacoense TaxID=4108 RepID=A0A0V0IUV2_SOLCH